MMMMMVSLASGGAAHTRPGNTLHVQVAEKPSLAQSIAEILSNGRSTHRRGALDIHEFDGSFRGQMARFKMTSVIGMLGSLSRPCSFTQQQLGLR
jgi:protein involved in polysaccharide export with SLBB domain